MSNTSQIALAIALGSALVAGAIFFSGNVPFSASATAEASVVRSEYRALYGNEDAEITIVEFSDYECPFCSRVHPTLKQLVDDSEGRINWEYRHFPLPSHKSAELAAIVGECVLRNKGNDVFWQYSDEVFNAQRSINTEYLTSLGEKFGLTADDIALCRSDESIAAQINADVATARRNGGSGTPFSIVVLADGTTQSVRGALPLSDWQRIVQ